MVGEEGSVVSRNGHSHVVTQKEGNRCVWGMQFSKDLTPGKDFTHIIDFRSPKKEVK